MALGARNVANPLSVPWAVRGVFLDRRAAGPGAVAVDLFACRPCGGTPSRPARWVAGDRPRRGESWTPTKPALAWLGYSASVDRAAAGFDRGKLTDESVLARDRVDDRDAARSTERRVPDPSGLRVEVDLVCSGSSKASASSSSCWAGHLRSQAHRGRLRKRRAPATIFKREPVASADGTRGSGSERPTGRLSAAGRPGHATCSGAIRGG